MRKLLLVMGLAAVALAGPEANRAAGLLSGSQSIRVEGAYFTGTAKLEPVTDLRECRQYRFSLNLTSKTRACWAVHVVLLDASNRIVGACSFNQMSPESKVELEKDIGMSDVGAVKRFQLVFYEDTRPIGSR